MMNPKNKFITTIIISFVTVGGLGWTFVYLVNGVTDAAAGLELVELEIREEENGQQRARALRSVFEERAEDVERIQSFFVNRVAPVGFIEYLEDTSRKTATTISLDIKDVPKDKNLYFMITIDGTKKTTLQYLSLLELAPFDIKIADFNFQKLNLAESKAPTNGAISDSRLVILIKVNTR